MLDVSQSSLESVYYLIMIVLLHLQETSQSCTMYVHM